LEEGQLNGCVHLTVEILRGKGRWFILNLYVHIWKFVWSPVERVSEASKKKMAMSKE